jgi:hypothetical protein
MPVLFLMTSSLLVIARALACPKKSSAHDVGLRFRFVMAASKGCGHKVCALGRSLAGEVKTLNLHCFACMRITVLALKFVYTLPTSFDHSIY